MRNELHRNAQAFHRSDGPQPAHSPALESSSAPIEEHEYMELSHNRRNMCLGNVLIMGLLRTRIKQAAIVIKNGSGSCMVIRVE
jgi:hypothetical protein